MDYSQSQAPDPSPSPTFNRDLIRSAVLNAPGGVELVNAFGVEIELRAPDLKGLMAYRGAQNDENVMARSIINVSYVPGTNDKVFEDADLEVLNAAKMSPDMKKLITAVNRVLGGDEDLPKLVEEEKKS